MQAAGLLFYRLMEARARSDDYPIEEINDYLRTHPDRRRRRGAHARLLRSASPRAADHGDHAVQRRRGRRSAGRSGWRR